jgi:hypothetical protein
MQSKRTMGLMAMQKYGDGNDGDVGQREGGDRIAPPRQRY